MTGKIENKKLQTMHFGTPVKLGRLTKTCENEASKNVWTGKYLFDTFCIKNDLKQGDVSSLLPFKLVLQYAIRKV
jgi:hypothetical protein